MNIKKVRKILLKQVKFKRKKAIFLLSNQLTNDEYSLYYWLLLVWSDSWVIDR